MNILLIFDNKYNYTAILVVSLTLDVCFTQ